MGDFNVQLTPDQQDLRSAVIRECIAALPEYAGEPIAGPFPMPLAAKKTLDGCRAALESLLPKPDRAKELVEEYRQTFKHPDIVACCMDDELEFAQWLVSAGKLP